MLDFISTNRTNVKRIPHFFFISNGDKIKFYFMLFQIPPWKYYWYMVYIDAESLELLKKCIVKKDNWLKKNGMLLTIVWIRLKCQDSVWPKKKHFRLPVSYEQSRIPTINLSQSIFVNGLMSHYNTKIQK